jgi:hypothetical protein
LAVLPERALTGEGERVGEVADWSFPLEGAIQETFAREARHCHCYIVAATYLREDQATKRGSNAAILFDRNGNVAGLSQGALGCRSQLWFYGTRFHSRHEGAGV